MDILIWSIKSLLHLLVNNVMDILTCLQLNILVRWLKIHPRVAVFVQILCITRKANVPTVLLFEANIPHVVLH